MLRVDSLEKTLMLGGEGDDRGWDGWMHHWLNGRESEWTPGVGDAHGGLVCCDSWGHKELDTIEWLNWTELNFPYFLQFKSEFGNKEFMIWATVSSWPCFCWLYRASSSLAAKNIINLISVLTMVMSMSKVFSCVVGRGYLLWPVCSLGKTLLLAFAVLHFVLQGQICPLLQVSLDFLLLHFQSPMMKRTSFLGVRSRRSCRSS